MKLRIGNEPLVKGHLIAQEVGKFVDYSRYYKQQTITDKIPLEGRKYWDRNIRQVGEVINLVDEENNLNRLAMIKGIESFEYEFVDLVVNYRVEVVEPWTKQQMDKAIHENRLSTFRVLRSESND